MTRTVAVMCWDQQSKGGNVTMRIPRFMPAVVCASIEFYFFNPQSSIPGHFAALW